MQIKINQQIVDEVKSKPLAEQVRFLLEFLDNDVLDIKERGFLLQFEDILADIKTANVQMRKIKYQFPTVGDILLSTHQSPIFPSKSDIIDEVVRMRS